MSMASGLGGGERCSSGVIRSSSTQPGGGANGGDRFTPDSARNSLVHLAAAQLQQQKQNSESAAGSRTATPPVDKEPVFRYVGAKKCI